MENNRIETLLDNVGLNWGVKTEEVQTESGIVIPGYKAIIRDDNNKPLSIRGEDYEVFNNYQLLELLDKVSQQSGLPIHNGGFFGNGEKVYIQLKSDDLKLGKDKIKGFLTGINSFDGSTSLAFGPSNITVSCMNTFYAAFRGIKSKVRHTKNMTIKIEDVLRSLDLVLVEEKKMFENIVKMSETRIGEDDIDNVIRKLFNISDGVTDLEDDDQVSTVTRNKMSRFYVDLDGEMKQKGDNLWGLFSGVTKYTTHTLGEPNSKGVKKNTDELKMFGMYGNREREIFNELAALV